MVQPFGVLTAVLPAVLHGVRIHLAALRAVWRPYRGGCGEDEIQEDWVCY